MTEPHQVIWWRDAGISWPRKSAVYMFVLQKILATNDSNVPKEALSPPAETCPWQLTSSSHLKIPTQHTKTALFWSQMESTSAFFQGFWLCILLCCAQSCNLHFFFFTSPNPVTSPAKQRDPFVGYRSDCQALLSSGLMLPVLYGDSVLLFLIN